MEKLRDLASELGVYVDAVLAGTDTDAAAKELITYGAKKVFVVKDRNYDEYDTQRLFSLLTAMVQKMNPEAVAFADSFTAKDVGPRLAQRLGTSFVSACTALSVEERERKIVQTHKVFGDKVTFRRLTTVNAPQVFSIKVDTSMEPYEADYARGEVIEWIGS